MQTKEQNKGLVSGFWESLLGGSRSDKSWITYYPSGKPVSHSPKDLVAQAHCIAAYLLKRGAQSGEKVAIISGPSPFYLSIDLALQFLGLVNITFPEDVSAQDFEKYASVNKVRTIFIEKISTFTHLNELETLRTFVSEIILYSDEVEGFNLDKIITFDRVIPLGKSLWREHNDLLKVRKSQQEKEDVYALLYQDDHSRSKGRPVTFGDLESKSNAASSLLAEANVGVCLNWADPWRLTQRAFSFWGPIQNVVPVISSEERKSLLQDALRFKPNCIITSPDQLEILHQEIAENYYQSSAGRKRKFEKMLALLIQRGKIVESNGKVPFLMRTRYRFAQRGPLRKIRAMLGGKLNLIVCDYGNLPHATQVLLQEAGSTIHRPN